MKHAFHLCILFIVISCAQQTQPTGGPKDDTPPVLMESKPDNGKVNFKGTQIELSFSEFIQLDKPKDQIIISPSVKDIETSYQKNKVILKFKSPLRDSTTYSINFREAVQDITERNPATNLKLAFSTGSYLDSLSISGSVFDLLTAKPAGDITVALHYESDTFNIFKHKAEIFTKADKQGYFLIENLKSETFYIYAFQDKNKNLFVDARNEKYGFLSSKFTLIKNEEAVMVPMVSIDSRGLRLISARPSQNYFLIKTNKGIKSYNIQLTDTERASYSRGDDNASIKLYRPSTLQDSTKIRLVLTDSLANTLDTTLYAKFNPLREDLRLEKFTTKLEKVSVLNKTADLTTVVKFNKPIRSILYDSIYFVLDSATRYVLKPEEIKLDTQQLQLRIQAKIPTLQKTDEAVEQTVDKSIDRQKAERTKALSAEQKSTKPINELKLGKGAVMSVDNDSSAYQSQKASFYKEEDLAITLVESPTKAQNFFIEILTSQGIVVQTTRNQQKAAFKDLIPGEYLLRLIIDNNNNGLWDNGNYFKREEPEAIYYYVDDEGNQKFNLKANWEYGPLLINPKYRVNNLGTVSKK